MPTEERRLAAEEGSLSKNTWSQKIARGFSAARRAPEKGPSRRVTHHTSTVTTLCHILCHTLSLGPGRDADRRKKTGSRRRIVIKEHLSQKIARGFSAARRAPEKGPSLRVTFTPTLSHSITTTLSHYLPVTFSVTLCHTVPGRDADRRKKTGSRRR